MSCCCPVLPIACSSKLNKGPACAQLIPELALMSTAAGGTAPLVAEALRAGEGAVRPDLLQALRGAAGAVLPMDAVQEAPQPEPPAHQAAQQTVVRAFVAGTMSVGGVGIVQQEIKGLMRGALACGKTWSTRKRYRKVFMWQSCSWRHIIGYSCGAMHAATVLRSRHSIACMGGRA